MAAKIPVRFKRTAEAFEVVGRSKGFPESSSGSELSPDDDNLFDRVNSFIERDDYYSEEELPINYEKNGKGNYEFGSERDLLSNLLSSDDDDDVKRNLRAEIEKAYRIAGDSFSPEFKRRLMIQLRERGFDAGLCKSKWEKMGQISSEYIDANVAGTRYIIEVSLAGQFEIARPSKSYTLLLELLPPIFVGNIEELKQIAKIMCMAIKMSLKNMEIMHMPPWRRYEYVKAKWSSSYKRTVNDEVPDKKLRDSNQVVSTKKSALVGFSPLPATSSYYCRENFVSLVGLRVGHLDMAINGIR